MILLRYEYLSVFDGKTPGSNQLGKFCGETLPQSIQSEGNELLLHLKSEQMAKRRNFELFYFGECGGYLTSNNGTIIHHDTNSNYSSNQACFWLIRLPKGLQINITIDFLDIEDHSECQ